MKKVILVALFCLAFASMAGAQGYGHGSSPNDHFVNPYQKLDGTFVPGHYQTNPNRTDLDNYGTRGNYNPYTGAVGNRSPRRY
ncbi:MAG: hypothetical protein ACLQPD_17680 [Desulfomonilaceae bacterium]